MASAGPSLAVHDKYVFPNINRTQTAEIDLKLQTRPSEGPSTYSLWLWRKSVQRFPRYFIHEQKSSQTCAENWTCRSSLLAVKTLRRVKHACACLCRYL